MTEPSRPQSPAAWRVAMACQEATDRFERTMRDLNYMQPDLREWLKSVPWRDGTTLWLP